MRLERGHLSSIERGYLSSIERGYLSRRTASEQSGNNFKGLTDVYLKAKDRIWP